MYRIIYADGSSTDTAATYAEAAEIIRSIYPDAEIGHDGDLADGGDRTLAWPDAESAEDDAGVLACAEIRRVDE